VAGFTTCSRGEVPGERKPVMREQHDDDDDILLQVDVMLEHFCPLSDIVLSVLVALMI
jgi:hypothetical protein